MSLEHPSQIRCAEGPSTNRPALPLPLAVVQIGH